MTVEINDQFQREFGWALAQLRAVHAGLVLSADNARDEAKALSATGETDQAVASYESAHAYWSAADRLRPVLGSFEDADRVAATLMEAAGLQEELGTRPHVVSEPPVMTPEPSPASYAEIVNAELGASFLMPIGEGRSLRFRALYDGEGKITVGLFRDVPCTSLQNTLALAKADRGRVKFLEGQLQRLDAALGGRMADTDDLIDLAIQKATSTQEKDRADREHERAERLAKVTTELSKLLGVTTIPELQTAVERLVTGKPFDFETLPEGSLIAGQWVGSFLPERRVYVGRFEKIRSDGSIKINRICTACDDLGGAPHVVSTDLAPATVRLPAYDEIREFDKLGRAAGLLRLTTESDE